MVQEAIRTAETEAIGTEATSVTGCGDAYSKGNPYYNKEENLKRKEIYVQKSNSICASSCLSPVLGPDVSFGLDIEVWSCRVRS